MNFQLDVHNGAIWAVGTLALVVGAYIGALLAGNAKSVVIVPLYPFILVAAMVYRAFYWFDKQTQLRVWLQLAFTKKLDSLTEEQIELSRVHYGYTTDFNPVRRWFTRQVIAAVDRRNGGKVFTKATAQ